MAEPRTTGPLFKNGVDLYDEDRTMQWTIVIFIFLFVVGFFIYTSVAVNNLSFEHTYFKNPGMPGVLTSTRYSFPWIVVMISIVAMGVLWLFICFMIVFRDNYGCHMLWFFLYFLAMALLIFALVMLSVQYADCNTQPDNLCNDKRWCCVNFLDPANGCPNTAPCPGVTASDLVPTTEFLWLYWTLAAVAILHVIFFVVLIVYWFSPPPPARVVEEPVLEDKELVDYKMPEPRAKPHGLRKRI